jgi:hypothetical protein
MFRICNNKINNNIDNKLNLDIKMLYKKNELLNIKKFNSIFKNSLVGLACFGVTCGGPHTAPCNGLKQTLDLRCTACEGVIPEVVPRILDEFNEGDEQAPRMRPIHNQSL